MAQQGDRVSKHEPATLNRTTRPARALVSILFMGALAHVILGLYRWLSAENHELLTPTPFMAMEGHSILRELLTQTASNIVIVAVVFFAVLMIARTVVRLWARRSRGITHNVRSRGEGSREELGPPANNVRWVLQYGAKTNDQPFPLRFLRLKRAAIKFRSPPATPEQHLEAALLAILLAHKEWPADPDGHHANVGLAQHSINVANILTEQCPQHPLARAIGLAHDIGKLVAYFNTTKNGQRVWERRTTNHDLWSATIVRWLPEYQSLPGTQQQAVNMILSFAHHPDDVPIQVMTDHDMGLLHALIEADGIGTRNDRATARDNASDEEVLAELAEALTNIIPSLNVNRVDTTAHISGWASSLWPFVAILESHLRQSLKGVLKQSTAAQIALYANQPPSAPHPATPAITNALGQMGLLIREYKGQVPDDGMFQASSGAKQFRGVLLLDRGIVETRWPHAVNKWGTEPPYTFKILRD